MLFVFMSQPDFACNPYALWKYIVKNTDYETGWILKRNNHYDTLRERGIRCALYDTLEGNRLVEEADYVIMNSYTYQNITKREKQIFVNLWHGSGIKAHDYFDHNMSAKQASKLKTFFDKTDLLCVHSLDDRFRLSAMLHFDIRKCYVTGQPRLDGIRNSDGRKKLTKILGKEIAEYDHLIFFAPSFRANMSTHSGRFYSDNIFRLNDYNDDGLRAFLEKNHAALIYKLHPIEQSAFLGRKFEMNAYCFELTDDMLFDAGIQYGEILNAFDIMMSDYSSIAFDFLMLDRPIVYLIPDYEEYKNAKGFVFRNIDYYMPGPKVYCFEEMLSALLKALENPESYAAARQNVRMQRFDFLDDQSSERCFQTITNYKPIKEYYESYVSNPSLKMPSSAELLQRYIQGKDIVLVDSTKEINDREILLQRCHNAGKAYYITGEIPNQYRRLSGRNSYKIADLDFYYEIEKDPEIVVAFVGGGVEYEKFSRPAAETVYDKIRLGFAGTIDNRIYFAMVQLLCEAFPEFEIIFAGDIIGDFPAWLSGYDNLQYIEASYDELPGIIQSFDVALLPFFGGHKKTVPAEFFQYLACGKSVVSSNMPNLPACEALYVSKSISDSVEQVKKALNHRFDETVAASARRIAEQNDWGHIFERILSADD